MSRVTAPLALLSPTLVGLQRRDLGREIATGVTVAALTLPSSLGYAEAAGLPAVFGLYAAMVGMLLFGLFGGTRHLVLGPDAAFTALIGATLAEAAGRDPSRAIALAPVMAALVGMAFIGLGLLRASSLASFLSRPLLSGFMTGLAVTIVVGQIPKLLGISAPASSTLGKIADIVEHLGDTEWESVVLGVAAFLLTLLVNRLAPRVPAAALILVIGLLAVVVLRLDEEGVAVLGDIPVGLPDLDAPSLRWDDLSSVLTGSLALAAIGFADAVLQGRQYAKQGGYAPTPDRDLIAMGVANLGCSIASGYPVGASASRSAAALNGGGRSTLVSVWAAALIGLTLVLLAPYLDQLPIPVLAGIIVASAVRLIALQDIYALWPGHKTELVVAVSAALGVIMAGVLAGVGIALAISLLAFVRRAANPHCAVLGRRAGRAGWFDTERYPEARQEPGVLVFRFDGPLFFASAEAFHTHLLGAIDAATPAVRRVVVHAPAISSIDVTASEMLRDLILEMDARGIDVVVSGARGLLRDQLRNGGVVPDDRLYKTVEEALAGDATE